MCVWGIVKATQVTDELNGSDAVENLLKRSQADCTNRHSL